MAKDVNTALVDVVSKYLTSESNNRATALSAKELLQGMKEDGRYLVDVWS